MSAVVRCYLLPRANLDALVHAAHRAHASGDDPQAWAGFHATLASLCRAVDPDRYPWSGYCLPPLLDYLQDLGVPVLDTPYRVEARELGEFWGFVLLLAVEHQRFLDVLDPARHDPAALAWHYEESGFGFDEAGRAGLDGIALLRDGIASLTADEIFLVHVG